MMEAITKVTLPTIKSLAMGEWLLKGKLCWQAVFWMGSCMDMELKRIGRGGGGMKVNGMKGRGRGRERLSGLIFPCINRSR